MNVRLVTCLLLLAPALSLGRPQTPSPSTTSSAGQTSTAPSTKTCSVDRSVPTTGENLLAADDNVGAEAAFRSDLQKTPDSSDLRLGLIRALVAQNKLPEAQTEASAFLASRPKDAIAEVAAAELAFRMGDIDSAVTHARTALAENPCEGRAAGAMASMLELSGYHATMVRYLNQGHLLRPTDEAMTRYWVANLPRERRLQELSAYLAGPNHLSTTAVLGARLHEATLKAYRPGECAVTAPAGTITLPLQHMMGDRSQVTGFTVEVHLGNKLRRFVITTTGSGITLSEGTAHALGLQAEYQLPPNPPQKGKSDGFLAHVPNMRAGDLEATNCLVQVSSRVPAGWDGIIGAQVFQQWALTLDYAREELRLDPLPPRPTSPASQAGQLALDDRTGNIEAGDRYLSPEMKDWPTLFRIEGVTLIPGHITRAAAHQRYLLLEDASLWTALSPAMAKEGGVLSESSLHALSGPIKTFYRVDQLALSVGNLNLSPATYSVFDMATSSNGAGIEISGILGLPFLQHLTLHLDLRDNLFKMDYDPNARILRF